MSIFWAGTRVFLTGHTKFKGSWPALWLQHIDPRVTGYALPPPPATSSLFEIARVGAAKESILGDVTNYNHLVSTLRSAVPDIVIHIAAQLLVRYSYANPCKTYRTNFMGTVYLLQAVRQVNLVRAVLNITSDRAHRDHDRLGGRDPCSNSKACAELVSSAFRGSFFSPSHVGRTVAPATARAGNVIGGGDWAQDRLIPDILTHCGRWWKSARRPRFVRRISPAPNEIAAIACMDLVRFPLSPVALIGLMASRTSASCRWAPGRWRADIVFWRSPLVRNIEFRDAMPGDR
ncbi:GDP-mannose 4,6-dehydratase [Bradyrhizobium sp. 521_C7_N1_3]|uniref:GDP-mannose 4,6-dehydratase n=1 Tax=Bradyrhizobium sp. 521_C7_N1_3 TaxID=3240368 RepID=UPI003F8A3049